jgi:asparagine synthase (glutamine-hydrolysing)
MIFENLEIVYNGEVYNFEEIRNELERENYTFFSNSDTEVILKAYHRWGIKAVDKFNGMFSIVFYDKKNEEIVFIRDRAGVKPFYYYMENNLFLFASELKSFHKHPEFNKKVSIEGTKLFFQYGYILEPYTIFENTYKLEAGHYLKLNLKTKKHTINKYWEIIDFYNYPKLDISFKEAKDKTKQLLKDACEYRMIADVPVGIFLSGGYDSSAVAAILQNSRDKKLKTFTIGFHEQQYNEANEAKKIAKHLGTEHTEYYCTQKDALDILPKLPEIWDEPFGDNSVIPTTLVSQLAKKDVKVSLSADGGDEVFGGYSKYTLALKYHKLFSKVPFKNKVGKLLEKIPSQAFPFLNKTYNFDFRFNKVKDLLQSKSHLDTMNKFTQFFKEKELNSILNMPCSDIITSFNQYNLLNSYNDDLDKLMAIDYKTYQLDNILVKVDRATMSVSLEGREPLLDHNLIEFVSKLPNSYKIHNGDKKYLLKSIVHDFIPKKLMDRPKMGFSMPLDEWFGDELKVYINEYLDSYKIKEVSVLNTKEVENLKVKWLRDGKDTSKIWLILVYMMWWEKWMK